MRTDTLPSSVIFFSFIIIIILVLSLCSPLRALFLSAGFLGDGDVVTQAIHDAQQLLRSHGSAGRERDREREVGGKPVS